MLYSLLYTMHAMSANLSPVASSSGFEQIDGDNFKVNIFQTVTGIKFIVISDLKQQNIDILLRKMYELYSDVLKDPLYTNNSQPIKNSLFDNALQFAIEQFEKTGNVSWCFESSHVRCSLVLWLILINLVLINLFINAVYIFVYIFIPKIHIMTFFFEVQLRN